MSCKFRFLRKSLLSSLVIAGLSALSITGFGFAVAPAFGQAPAYRLPPETQPAIPDNDIVIYIHGGPGSKLEEASDLVNPLLQAGLLKNKRYTIISFDQVSQGYSSMVEPTAFLPPPPGAQSITSFPITAEQRVHFDVIDGYMDTKATINQNSDGSGSLKADTHTWSMSWAGFHGAVAVAILDVTGNKFWTSHTITYGVDAKKGRYDTLTDTVPAGILSQARYLAIIQKYNPKTAFNDINGWLQTLNNRLQELENFLKDIPKTIGAVPEDHIDEYYPLVAFSEESIVAFVNELDKIAPIKNRNIYFIGGSTGGALALRMGHRQEPWIKKIVAWNPASVWTTYTHDLLKTRTAVDTGFSRSKEEEKLSSRGDYFKGVFGTPLTGLPESVVNIQPNPEEWYRGGRNRYLSSRDTDRQQPFRADWYCKWDYIGEARLEQEEIYNQTGRRWHYRLGTEMLTFSFFNDTWAGPANTAAQKGNTANYLSINKPTLLVAGDDDDWNVGWIPPGVGSVIGIPPNPTPVYFRWEDRWTQVRAMAPLMRNTPLTTLYLPNTGHSIHNERPNLFATQIVQFLTGSPLTTVFNPNLCDEVDGTINCAPQACNKPLVSQLSAGGFSLPPGPALLDAPSLKAAQDAINNLSKPATLGGHFSDGKGSDPGTYTLRLRPELRVMAQTKVPAFALGAAAASYYIGDATMGDAFADLSVTGRAVYDAFRSNPPSDAYIATAANNILPIAMKLQTASGNERIALVANLAVLGPLAQKGASNNNQLPNQATMAQAVSKAKDRAYKVAWALRNPYPEAGYNLRKDLGWIAVSAEDDSPDRPVNVPSGIPIFDAKGKQVSAYPQYEIPITMCPTNSPPYVPYQCDPNTQGGVTFKIRYTVATLSQSQPSPVPGAGPVIKSVSPSLGPITGGTLVHVAVAGGSANSTTVSFNGGTPPRARCDDQGNCWFTTPPNAKPGPVNIVVTAQGASAIVPRVASEPLPFTYTLSAALAGLGHDQTTTDQAAYMVSLDGNAPASGAAISITSSDSQAVAVPQNVTIKPGLSSASFPVVFFPTPKTEAITITAKYGDKSVPTTINVTPWPPVKIDPIVPPNAAGRFTLEANVTITLLTLAPSGGNAVALRWSGDLTALSSPPPTSVTVPAGSYSTTFKVTASNLSTRTNGMIVYKQITLTATPANGAAVSVSTSVPFPVPLPRPPGGPNGTRQY